MPPVAVSEAELKAIHNLPAHRRVKYQAWTLISAGVFSTLMTLGSLATTAYFGHYVLLYHRALWWSYGFGAGFSIISLAFTELLSHDIRNLQDPIQLILDIVRLEFSSLASAALLLVLYYKVRVLEPEKVFNLGCQSGCPGKYTWFRIGPLVVGCFTIFLSIVQLILFFQMFRNPLVNPPISPYPPTFAPNTPLLAQEEPVGMHESSDEYEEEYEMDARVQVSMRGVGRRKVGGEDVGLGDGRMRFSMERPQGWREEQYEMRRMGR